MAPDYTAGGGGRKAPGTLRDDRRKHIGGRGAHACAPPSLFLPPFPQPTTYALDRVGGAGGIHLFQRGGHQDKVCAAPHVSACGRGGRAGHPVRNGRPQGFSLGQGAGVAADVDSTKGCPCTL